MKTWLKLLGGVLFVMSLYGAAGAAGACGAMGKWALVVGCGVYVILGFTTGIWYLVQKK